MSRAILLSLLVTACDGTRDPAVVDGLPARPGGAFDVAPPPGAGGLTLTGPASAMAGDTVTFEVTAADMPVGARVEFGDGTMTGSGFCPYRQLTGGAPCLDIKGGVRALGDAIAFDDGGVVRARLTVQWAHTSPTAYVQAFLFNGRNSATSNVLPVAVDQPWPELDPRVDDLEGSVTALEADLAAAQGAVGGLDARMTAAEGEIVSLEGALSTANTNISSLQSSMSTANTNISSLQSSMSTANTNISSLQSSMSTANTNISSLQSSMSTANTNISSLQSSMSTANTNISSLQSSMSTANTNIATQTARINTLFTIEHMRAIIPKSTATSHCPTGTAVHVPRGYMGQTGNQICAADSRGLNVCKSVQYVYVTNGNTLGSYDTNNIPCSGAVHYPWPWGVSTGTPNTLDGEWGHGDTWVVCCASS